MADVRGASGVPATTQFSTNGTPSPSTPIYINTDNGNGYCLLGNVVTQIFSTIYSATVSTTNATITTIATIPIPSSTTVLIDANVVARRGGGSAGTAEDGAAYIIAAAYKNIATVATEIGESKIFTAEDQAGWDVTVTPSGSNALIQVTGAANKNIDWFVSYKLYTSTLLSYDNLVTELGEYLITESGDYLITEV